MESSGIEMNSPPHFLGEEGFKFKMSTTYVPCSYDLPTSLRNGFMYFGVSLLPCYSECLQLFNLNRG